MSKHRVQRGTRAFVLSGLVVALAALPALATGALDAPKSVEPRVAVAKCLTEGGLLTSRGAGQSFSRVDQKETVYSRDLVVALPGFRVDLEPTSRGVELSLRGNLPGISNSPVLESAVILHDTRAFDLDFTFRSGRVVLTNKKAKGAANVWLRTDKAGVRLSLAEPGDSLALELYGRWPTGVPFSLKQTEEPIRMWQIWVLKGTVSLKAGKTEWGMTALPGKCYFNGDSRNGANQGGPERIKKLPSWADPKAPEPELAKTVRAVIKEYRGKIKSKDADEAARELLAAAEKDKDKKRASVVRHLLVYAAMAIEEMDKVAELLDTSKDHGIRKTAVVALRHWIGVKAGRDRLLYDLLVDELSYNKVEAESFMQLLHSPFDPEQSETFETLIAYLRHRKQAVRELAHWHLVRLAPIGRDIPFDAAGSAAERTKAYKAWKKRVPSGELPKEPKDKTKDKPKDKKKE